MIVSKTPLLVAHLIGLCLSIGPVIVLDVRLARLLLGTPVIRQDNELAAALCPWIRTGLLLLWGSGAGFLAFYAAYTPEALTNPKLHAKLVLVCILTLNGLAVERVAVTQLAAREGLPLLDSKDARQRLTLLALGAVSGTGWYAVFLLGAVRELNFAVAAWTVLGAYLLAVAAAFCALWGGARLGRLVRPAERALA